MSTEESHVIVDCDQLLSFQFATYLPLFAQIAQQEASTQPTTNIFNTFSEQYHNQTLTLATVNDFFNYYRYSVDDLYAQLLINTANQPHIIVDRNELRPHALIELKDEALRNRMINLYKSHLSEPIIITTENPHVSFITACLNCVLPKGSFTVLYVPLLNTINELVSNKATTFTITSDTRTPPGGYSLLINSTRPPPKGDWQSYAAELEQRLLEDLREKEERKRRELKEREQKEKEQREKEREQEQREQKLEQREMAQEQKQKEIEQREIMQEQKQIEIERREKELKQREITQEQKQIEQREKELEQNMAAATSIQEELLLSRRFTELCQPNQSSIFNLPSK